MNSKEMTVEYINYLVQNLCKDKELSDIFFSTFSREGKIFSETFKRVHKIKDKNKRVCGLLMLFKSNPYYKFEQHTIAKVNEWIRNSIRSFLIWELRDMSTPPQQIKNILDINIVCNENELSLRMMMEQ